MNIYIQSDLQKDFIYPHTGSTFINGFFSPYFTRLKKMFDSDKRKTKK